MNYYWIKGSDAAAVLALTEDDMVVLTRQYRHPLHRSILDLPAGGVHPTETPGEAARRELLEETGYDASELRPLGRFYPVPGLLSYTVHVFAARVRQVQKPLADGQEITEVVLMPWQELLGAVVKAEDTIDVTLASAVLLHAAARASR